MSTLLVSGDSWTSCWPLEQELGHREYGWPTLVASKLNYTLIDKSRAGSSNYRIYKKAFDGILSDDVDLCLVFLTSWTRSEIGATYGEKPGRIYQLLPNDKDKHSEFIFKNFFNGYKNYTDLLRMIISLQKISEQTGKECYFLDTFDNNLLFDIKHSDFVKILSYNVNVFDNMDDDRIEKKFAAVQFLTSKIDRTKFISMMSYQTLIKGCVLDRNHPTADGHAKIAQTIYEFLKEKNHGQTI